MSAFSRFTPLIQSLPATIPFVGPEAQERKRGRLFRARIGANESVFGPSPRAIEAMRDAAAEAWKYCDPENHDLKQALAAKHSVRPENIGWRFYAYMAGQLVSNLGDQIVQLAAGLLIVRLTGSAFQTGLLTTFAMLPNILFSLPAGTVADRVSQALSGEPFVVGDDEVFLSASIGVVPVLEDGSAPMDMIRDADAAMYHAKQRGRSRTINTRRAWPRAIRRRSPSSRSSSRSAKPASRSAPMLITVVTLVWLFRFVDGVARPLAIYVLGYEVPGLGVLITAGFILLALKYIEISWRNPEGGGVVTITTKAFGPMWGCLGGMLITVDYFLTTAISAVSGFQYIGSVFPSLDAHIIALACIGVGVLAVLNIIGIRESATVALVRRCLLTWRACASVAARPIDAVAPRRSRTRSRRHPAGIVCRSKSDWLALQRSGGRSGRHPLRDATGAGGCHLRA